MSQSQEGQLQNYSVDQAAGAVVLVLGAVASLLLVVWQSKCHCRINLCYIFQCERKVPTEDEMKGLKDQFKKTEKKEDEILDEVLVPKEMKSPKGEKVKPIIKDDLNELT
tara:strand:- start:181 stop:510 length:330 start_codon:yes stop_codon:yes gene_type:complete